MNTRAAPLVLGLLAGAGLAWTANTIFHRASTTGSDTGAPVRPFTLSGWSWRDTPTPPALDTASARAAIAAWLAQPGTYAQRVETLRALLARLGAADITRVLDGLLSAKDPSSSRLLDQAFDVLVERDPAAASRWAYGAAPDHYGRLEKAAVAWSKLDALAAATWACSLPKPWLATRLLPALAKTDPQRALDLARSRDDAFFEAVMPNLLKMVGASDPAAALRTFGPRLWKNGQGLYALREPLAAWLARDPVATLAWVNAQSSPSQFGGSLRQFLSSLIVNKNIDPAALPSLADTVATMPGLRGRQSALSELLSRWSTLNPDAALAWLKNLPDPDLRLTLLENQSNQYSSDFPEKSLPFILALPNSSHRDQTLSNRLQAWAQKDPDAALAWIRDHPEAPAQALAKIHAGLIINLARDEPASAVAEWEKLPNKGDRAITAYELAAIWGKTDPAAALQWFGAHTEEGSPPDGALSAWLAKDPVAALRWSEQRMLAEIARYENQPTVADNYLDTLSQTANGAPRPRAATADLFAKIEDPALRTYALTRHLSEWLSKDRPAAQKWLESNSALTPDQAARLLEGSR